MAQFGSNPARATTTARGTRTTAGTHRIPAGGSAFRGARPLSEFPTMLFSLRRECSTMPPSEVRALAYAVKSIVDREGGKYKLRGHKGGKFPLEAEVQKARKFLGVSSSGKRQLGEFTSSLTVAGVPAGFWRIVEEGSKRHLIHGRNRRGSGNRLTTRSAVNAFNKAFNDPYGAGKFDIANPIRLNPGSKGPGGWRQWADHPGHGPIGRPWRKSMVEAQILTRKFHDDYVSRQLRAAWGR